MLSQEKRRIADLFQYPNGMLNVGWVSGFLRGAKPGARQFFVQQTNNANLMVPFILRPGEYIPPGYTDGTPVRVICHLDGGIADAVHLEKRNDGEFPKERIARATCISIDRANILTMPTVASFKIGLPKGAAEGKPVEFKPFAAGEERLPGSSNTVRIAGFVQSSIMQPPNQPGEAPDCCMILIRQQENEERCIPVRYYGHLARAVHNIVKRGMPLLIYGQLRVRAKPIGEIDPVSKIAEVARYLYVHCEEPPKACTQKDIKAVPDWANEMMDRYFANQSPRQKKAAPSQEAQVTQEADADEEAPLDLGSIE